MEPDVIDHVEQIVAARHCASRSSRGDARDSALVGFTLELIWRLPLLLTRCLRSAQVYVRVCAFGAMLIAASSLGAQAFNYPSLQLPSASSRDYSAALGGGAGTTALFQWREGWTPTRHLGLDAGVVDRKGSDKLMLFVGGSVGQELVRASKEQPLDLLLTGGAGLAFSSGVTVLRIPVGLSIGHTFELDQGMSLTPYVHPRLSFDNCSSCGTRGRGKAEASLNFDLGANFQVSSHFAVRAAGSFSGADLVGTEDSFAVGLVWTPAALVKR